MRHFARPLAVVLAAQQLLYSVPAAGTVQLDDGRHFDDAALLQLSAASSASVPSNLFGGEAVHGMPIVVPPGVGEATPSISLGYRSRGPNGALGLGWSLELGVPAMIERSIRDGAPEYDASDEFELAGQRLIATGEPGRYVTERFDHGRIDYVSAGNYWRVLRPDGLRLSYGFDPSGSNASRLDSEQVMSPAPIAVDCGSGSQLETCTALHEVIPAGIPFAWYLDRIEDRNGNAIRLSWSSLGDPGARYLTRIDYGYHVPNTSPLPAFGSATTQSAPLARAVVFDYEVRLDAFPTFRTGFRRELRHRLKSITPQSGGVPVRHYHLGYVQSAASGRSLLEAIEVRGADDDTSTARTHSFTYTDGGTPGWSATPDPAWAVQPVLLDWLGRDNGVRLLDLNADGFMDVLHGNFVDQPGAYLGGPNGFSTTRDPGSTPPPIFTTDYFDRRSNGLLFGDFNGDRRIDVMRRRLQLEPWNSPPASELNPPCDDVFETIELEHGDISHEQGYYDYPAPQPPDPDGQAWLNTGSGWAPAPEHEFPKVDIAPELTSLTHPPDPPGATYPFTRSCPKEAMPTGYLFTDQSDAFWIGHGYQNGIEAVDVNGDGRDDLAYFRQMDQNEWTMVKVSPTVSRQQHVRIVESRAGVRINDPESGLAGGTFNNSHFAVTEARTPVGIPPLTWDGASVFRKAYDLPRWQLPQTRPGEWTNPNAWSQLRWCIASGYLNVGMVSAGHQRIIDVNADGLPDILSAVDHDVTPVSEALLNDGYNWIAADELPDLAARPAEDLIRLQPGQGFAMAIQPPYPTVCLYDPGTAWFQSEDRGWRVVDVNGDGGPDFLGGGGYVVVNESGLVPGPTQIRLWNASAPADSLWGPDGATGWALPEGVTFVPWPFPETSPPMPRLADVNGDGMVDIVVQAGAHLNLASPPDLLDTVTTPLGAVTDFDYRPSTAFETPSSASQLEDRQIANPEPTWVLSRTTLDPGSIFGQPAIVNEIEYFGATYDLDDRALRGFQVVRVVGPAANGVRRITETEFHLSDALAGQPRRARVFSEPAGGGAATLLAEQLFDYARQDGDEAEPSVALSAGGSAPLDTGPTRDAFLAWGMLVAGDARASLAYPVASMQREYEGQATPLEAVSTRSFDLYGNLVHVTADDLADPRSPEFEASIDYAILDDVVGDQQVLLANRPASVVATGDPTGLPSGTATQRESRIFYDQSATLGNVLRGNPTRSQQLWLTQWVERQTSYDPFGNPVTLSAQRLVDSPDPMTLTLLGYDAATQSFVDTITRGFGTPLELVTTLEYARSPSSGCGVPPADARFAGDPDPGAAPVGMGLVCSIVDPNGQVSDLYYDRFGRLVNERGPGGFERATSYRDADLGTFAQRVEEALRWDPSAGAPAADANAITSARYLDGLGRSHTEVRRGLPASGPDVAARTLAYDAAGRLQSSSRWKFGGGGPLTTFQYDALDRPTRIDLPGGTYSTSTYERRGVVREDFLPGEGLTRKKRILLDGFGRVAQLHEFADPGASIGAITSYLYDPFGALVRIDDPIANDPGLCPQSAAACPTQQHTTTIRYDNRGDRVSIDDPDAGLWLFVLDERRRVGMQFNADGFVHFTHDELDRLTGRTSDSEQSFEYGLAGSAPPNGVGRLLRATDASGEDAFGYDEAGNVAFHRRTLDGLAFEFTRTFDPLGRTLSTEYPDGELVGWHYERQLLQRISSSGGTYAGDYLSDARYDALDRPESLGLGGSAGSPVLAEARDYDPTTALLDRIDAVAGGQMVASGDYTLDGLGRVRAIQSLTKPVGTGAPQAIPAVYDYDGLDRLLETVHGTYAAPRNEFDVLGNLRKKDEAPGMGWLELDYEDPVRPHAVTSATPVSSATAAAIAYQYDPMGRVSLKTRSGGAPGPASTSVTYDLLGLPKMVTPSGGLATTFAYSALDLRVKTARADETVLTPEEGFEYLKNTQIASKHFFVDGRRIASSAVAWAAPVAGSAKPLFDLQVQLPPPWASARAMRSPRLRHWPSPRAAAAARRSCQSRDPRPSSPWRCARPLSWRLPAARHSRRRRHSSVAIPSPCSSTPPTTSARPSRPWTRRARSACATSTCPTAT